MEKLNWQEIVRAGKEQEQAIVHNQLLSEVWSFLKPLAEKEEFQNIDFDIDISFEHLKFAFDSASKAEFNVALNTRRCDQSTNNSISTHYRSIYKDGKKMGDDDETMGDDDETIEIPCKRGASQSS